jgi:hypothetical protein
MRLLAILALAGIIFTTPLQAQLPQDAYVGLYADNEHSQWCVNGEGGYAFDMWIWILPSERGVLCVEHDIRFPSNIIEGAIVYNSSVVFSEPTPPAEYSMWYKECQLDWHWTARQTLSVTSNEPSLIEIIPDPNSGECQVGTCQNCSPAELFVLYTALFVNFPPDDAVCKGTATSSSTWGAIKSLFRD